MSWQEHATYCDKTYKLLYKGVDIGLSAEFVQDVFANTAIDIDDGVIEQMYNSKLEVIRDKKIDEILS
jgi:hypothetical protein